MTISKPPPGRCPDRPSPIDALTVAPTGYRPAAACPPGRGGARRDVSRAARGVRQRSPTGPRTGFTSMIGVPSTASRLLTRTVVPSIATMSTRWTPMGLGRSADRVLNTPRGWPRQVVARAHDEHVPGGAIEPRQHQDRLADVEVPEAVGELGGDDQIGLGRALVALLRRRRTMSTNHPTGERTPSPIGRTSMHPPAAMVGRHIRQPAAAIVCVVASRSCWMATRLRSSGSTSHWANATLNTAMSSRR